VEIGTSSLSSSYAVLSLVEDSLKLDSVLLKFMAIIVVV
jgi:hypothetical protein